ncbi:MAG: DUF1385 domain-containing protein [Dehalococcoidia bacterium]
MGKPYNYGGQAVIEGVMMRGENSQAIAVRRPQGDVLVHSQVFGHSHSRFLRSLPIVRGMLALWETLTLGMQALLFSARIASGEEESLTPVQIWLALSVSLGFVAVVFFLAPLLLTAWLSTVIHRGLVVLFIEGVVRLGMLLAYVAGIGLVPDVHRVFEYHGAEHKTINAFEAGAPLHVHEVRKFGTGHARCGTGFLLVVMVFSVVVFAALGTPPLWIRLLSRVVLIPVIGSLAYEYIRFSAAHLGNPIVRWLVRPSLALQSFTTREPDDQQLEVAITALQEVLVLDGTAARLALPARFHTPARVAAVVT